MVRRAKKPQAGLHPQGGVKARERQSAICGLLLALLHVPATSGDVLGSFDLGWCKKPEYAAQNHGSQEGN